MPGGPLDGLAADTLPSGSLADDAAPAYASPKADPESRRRRRILLCAALACVLVVWLLARALAGSAQIDAAWTVGPDGRPMLAAARSPGLAGHVGDTLAAIESGGRVMPVDYTLLQTPSRWVVEAAERERQRRMHRFVAEALAQPRLTLVFAGGERVEVEPVALGYRALGGMFWLVALIALVPALVGIVVVTARPQLRNLLFCAMTSAQAAALMVAAIESVPGLGPPALLAALPPVVQMALDVITACAIVHVCAIHPYRLDDARWVPWLAWGAGAGVLGLQLLLPAFPPWWSIQLLLIGLGASGIALLTWTNRRRAHPFALVLRRFGLLTLAGLVATTIALAFIGLVLDDPHGVAGSLGVAWRVYFTALLVLLPSLSRAQHVMREFSMLVTITTVAAAIDLLCVGALSLGPFASLSVSLFVALALYVAVRHWMLQQLTRARVQTIERMFERLYVIARAMEMNPERAGALLATLLREVFEPLEAMPSAATSGQARVLDEGAALLVPVPQLQPGGGPNETQTLRYAGNGTRLFTRDDARLANRLVEQLRRAITFDRAVEQGRSEERIRLAQDLHDDIGARLLTLMYQAPTKEMENYLRHTLQDLKTLTRGLAAPGHLISEAAAEWKADLSQRLQAMPMELAWSFEADDDPMLGVVQWSSLTRILRELVTNAIAHSRARQLEVRLALRGRRMTLVVRDDGIGHDPQAWSQGLGLGGVRKRVKLLGGKVEWSENAGGGICCSVDIPDVGHPS